MDQLSPAELLGLKNLQESFADAHIYYWLTTTFTTIVAAGAGREILTTRMRLIVSGLYVLASFVFVSRWIAESLEIFRYYPPLAEFGISTTFPRATVYGQTFLFLAGTVSTPNFVLRGSMGQAT